MKEQDKIREIPEIVVAKSCYVLKDTTECFWGCEHPDDNVFCDNAKEYAANVMRVMELAALIAPTPATDIIADMENPYTEAPRNETEHDLEIRIAMATAWGECQFTALDIIPAAPTPTEPGPTIQEIEAEHDINYCPDPKATGETGLVDFPYTLQDYDGNIVRMEQDKETWVDATKAQQAADQEWALALETRIQTLKDMTADEVAAAVKAEIEADLYFLFWVQDNCNEADTLARVTERIAALEARLKEKNDD